MLLSNLAVLQPHSVPSFEWTLVMEDHILWPHVSVLRMIVSALPMHMLLLGEENHMYNVPHSSLASHQYWFIHSQDVPAHWPHALGTSVPTLALFDWLCPITTTGNVCRQSNVDHGVWFF